MIDWFKNNIQGDKLIWLIAISLSSISLLADIIKVKNKFFIDFLFNYNFFLGGSQGKLFIYCLDKV